MKKLNVISSVLFLLLTTIYATDPITEADYLIITHPQLDTGIWLTDLVALQEGRGFQVGVQYVQDGVTKVQKNALFFSLWEVDSVRRYSIVTSLFGLSRIFRECNDCFLNHSVGSLTDMVTLFLSQCADQISKIKINA